MENLITGDTATIYSLGNGDSKKILIDSTGIDLQNYPDIDTTMWNFAGPFPPFFEPAPASFELTINGTNFLEGARVSIVPQKGIKVDTTLYINSSELRAILTIERFATAGLRDVIVTNPDLQSDTLRNCVLLKPDPPPPPYVARIEPRSGEQGDTLDFSIIGEQFSDYSTITFVPPTGITIDNINLIYHNRINAKLFISTDAPIGPRDIIITNSDGRSDTLKNGFEVLYLFSFNVSHGWNMVSVPLIVDDYQKIILFSSAVSNAFAYVGNYVIKDTLRNGVGYWLKFENAQNIQLTGLPLMTDTIDVTAGWNLIGSISDTISAASIQPIGTSIISPLYGYSNGYFISNNIVPGKAYWIKVSSAGKLVLSSTLLHTAKEAK